MSTRHIAGLLCVAMAGIWATTALAQAPADVNPAVNTSAPQPASVEGPVAAPAAAPAASAPSAAPASGSEAPGPAAASHAQPPQSDQPPQAARAAKKAPAPAQLAATQAAATPAAGGSTDRIELGTTEISGNRELPKLMYIVPWQRAEVGKITGRPPNSLVDEALAPVDRSVFERQNSYYAALQAASASAASQPAVPAASPAAAAPRDEK